MIHMEEFRRISSLMGNNQLVLYCCLAMPAYKTRGNCASLHINDIVMYRQSHILFITMWPCETEKKNWSTLRQQLIAALLLPALVNRAFFSGFFSSLFFRSISLPFIKCGFASFSHVIKYCKCSCKKKNWSHVFVVRIHTFWKYGTIQFNLLWLFLYIFNLIHFNCIPCPIFTFINVKQMSSFLTWGGQLINDCYSFLRYA